MCRLEQEHQGLSHIEVDPDPSNNSIFMLASDICPSLCLVLELLIPPQQRQPIELRLDLHAVM